MKCWPNYLMYLFIIYFVETVHVNLLIHIHFFVNMEIKGLNI